MEKVVRSAGIFKNRKNVNIIILSLRKCECNLP